MRMKISLLGARSGKEAAAKGGMDSRISYDEQKSTLKLLGMTLTEAPLEGENRQKLGSRGGVVVLVAEWDQDAYRGGVRSGDIIAEVNSTRILSLQDLRKVLRAHDPHLPLFVFLLNSRGWRFVNLSFISALP